MDMDRLPYRSLYSVTLLPDHDSIFSYNSALAVPADSGPIDCALIQVHWNFPYTLTNQSCLYKDAP